MPNQLHAGGASKSRQAVQANQEAGEDREQEPEKEEHRFRVGELRYSHSPLEE